MATTPTGHRLINLRTTSAGCTCGATYTGDGSADIRAKHRDHKAKPARSPRARKATK